MGLIGGLATFSVHWLIEKLRPEDPEPSKSQYVSSYDKPILATVTAGMVFSSWICVFAFLVLALLVKFAGWESLKTFSFAALLSFFALAFAYAILALFVRCNTCNRRFFIQWDMDPNFDEPLFTLHGWSAVVLRIVLRKKFRCIYCGQHYEIKGRYE